MMAKNNRISAEGYVPPHFNSKTKRYTPKPHYGWGFVTIINSHAVDQLIYVTMSIETAYDIAAASHGKIVETTSFNDSGRRYIFKVVGYQSDFVSIWFTSNLSNLKGVLSKWEI